MNIESKHVIIQAPIEEVFGFVSDLNHFEQLLPAERISEWESREDYCSFKVQGTATIDLQKSESDANKRLLLSSGERSPFPFTLEVFFSTRPEGDIEVYQIMKGEINPFLKMMVEKPLQKLFDFIAERLEEVFNK